MSPQPTPPAPGTGSTPVPTLAELALPFAKIGISSFGGGLSAWVYREMVDGRRWISEEEFLGAVTMSQILPGANIVNLALQIGFRLRGGLGGMVAVLSLLVPPMIVVILMSLALGPIGHIDWLHDFLEGLAATAIGLSASVGLRSAKRSLRMGWWPSMLSLGVIAGVFGLGWPIVPVIFGLAVCGLLVARAKLQG